MMCFRNFWLNAVAEKIDKSLYYEIHDKKTDSHVYIYDFYNKYFNDNENLFNVMLDSVAYENTYVLN